MKKSLRELEGLSLTQTLIEICRVAELKLLSVLAANLEHAQGSTLRLILKNPYLRLDVRASLPVVDTCLIHSCLADRCHLIVHIIIGLIRVITRLVQRLNRVFWRCIKVTLILFNRLCTLDSIFALFVDGGDALVHE